MTYLSDILEQPSLLHSVVERYQAQEQQLLGNDLLQKTYRQVVLTGMGSSFYALLPSWLYLNQQGIPSIHIEASELVHYGLAMLTEQTLLIVVSQSGESAEIRRLVQEVGGRVTMISVTNQADNFLASQSPLSLCTQAGTEVPVATKTYTSSLAVLHLVARALTHHLNPQDYRDLVNVADLMATLLKNWPDWLEPLVEHLQPVSFFTLLGRGPAVSSALTGALLLKEAARLNAVGLSGGQFRHGPMEALSPRTGVLLFAAQGHTGELTQRLAVDIASHEGRVALIGQAAASSVVDIALPGVDEYLNPILQIVVIQLLAAQFAKNAGIVPGEFRWSGKVIQTE